MPEEVLFETERDMKRAEVAQYLRTVADKLDDGGAITLSSGGQELSLEPTPTVEFEVKAEREGPTDGTGELSLELELEWDEDGGEDDLSIA